MRKLAKRLVSPESGLICPDHWSGPDWVLTDGPAVAEVNAAANFAPDPQQELGLDLIFAVGTNGLPAAFSFCAICCRQNLKTGLLKQAAIGWLYVTDERKVVWSAHEMSTTTDAQKELGELMESSPALSRRMLTQKNRGIYGDNGSERIELRHLGVTQQILFKARRKTGGRGLAGDKVVLDEAFALEPSHVGSLLPTMMARPHGQVLYASSAGMAGSSVLYDVRDRGRKGSSPRMFYLEWGGAWRPCREPDCTHPKDAEQRGLDCALDDRELWAKNNPTVSTGRITLQTIADMRQELPPEEFARECMGKWDEPAEAAGPPEVNLAIWARLGEAAMPAPRRAVVVLHTSTDGSKTSIGMAGDGPDGRTALLATTRPGIAWVVESLKHSVESGVELLEVALHPSKHAAILIPELDAAGIDYRELTYKDFARGATAFNPAVEAARFVHRNQPELNTPIASARTRTVNGVQLWDEHDERMDISAVVATSTAAQRWAALTAKPDVPPPPPRRATPTRPKHSIATAGF